MLNPDGSYNTIAGIKTGTMKYLAYTVDSLTLVELL